MASLEKLRADYQAATEANRKAYDAFNGVWGDEQIKRNYEIAVRDKDKEAIARLKPKYEALAAAYKATQEEKNRLKRELTKAEKAATTKKETEAKAKGAAGIYNKALDKLAIAETGRGGYQGDEKYNEAYIAAENAYKDIIASGKTPKVELPAPVIPIKYPEQKTLDGQQGDQGGTGQQMESYTEIINGLAANENTIRQAQADAAKFGYKGGITGKWSTALQKAIENAYQTRGTLPKNLQGASFAEFFVSPQIDLSSVSGTTPRTTITNDVQAAAYIDAAVQSELNRSATSTEIKALTKALQAYEKANPTRYQGGTTTGGASPQNYLVQLIRGQQEIIGKSGVKTAAKLVNEFNTKKGEAQKLVTQDLLTTLAANGLDKAVGQDQLNTWAKRIQNGEKADTIKNEIRMMAKVGMPDNVKKLIDAGNNLDTIYAPYKKTMASILELDPNSISLNDKTLQAAIGPNGEMPLYDFQRALRQDPRWQYTNNAREEVSNSVMKVLQDFGFRG